MRIKIGNFIFFLGESENERARLAMQQSTSRSELLKLATDPDIQVRTAVAHKKIDGEIIGILVDDKDPNVRFSLINHANCDYLPIEYLEKLENDSEEFIRKRAKEIINERINEAGIICFYFYFSF